MVKVYLVHAKTRKTLEPKNMCQKKHASGLPGFLHWTHVSVCLKEVPKVFKPDSVNSSEPAILGVRIYDLQYIPSDVDAHKGQVCSSVGGYSFKRSKSTYLQVWHIWESHIASMGLVYLPTFYYKNQPDEGKYTIHGWYWNACSNHSRTWFLPRYRGIRRSLSSLSRVSRGGFHGVRQGDLFLGEGLSLPIP